MYPGDVPDSSPTTIAASTTWMAGVSDILPDSGLLRVLKSALLQAGGCPTQFLFVSEAAFASSSIIRDYREHPGIVTVLLRDEKSLASYQFSEGEYEI